MEELARFSEGGFDRFRELKKIDEVLGSSKCRKVRRGDFHRSLDLRPEPSNSCEVDADKPLKPRLAIEAASHLDDREVVERPVSPSLSALLVTDSSCAGGQLPVRWFLV